MATTSIACLCGPPTRITLVVDRPYYPSAGERTERKKMGLCPCADPVKRQLTGEERVQMLKAKLTGNCCRQPCALAALCGWTGPP